MKKIFMGFMLCLLNVSLVLASDYRDTYRCFVEACKTGNLEEVERTINPVFLASATDGKQNPLGWAIKHPHVMTVLLSVTDPDGIPFVNPCECDLQGNSLLIEACRQGAAETLPFLLELTDRSGTPIFDPHDYNDCGENAAYHAVCSGSLMLMQTLFEGKNAQGKPCFNVNDPVKRDSGDRAIHVATDRGDLDSIQYLLDMKNDKGEPVVDVNTENKYGWRPFERALYAGNRDAIVAFLMLRQNEKPCVDVSGCRSSFWDISQRSRSDSFLESSIPDGCKFRRDFELVARGGNGSAIEKAVDHWIGFKAREDKDFPLLDHELVSASSAGNVDRLRELLADRDEWQNFSAYMRRSGLHCQDIDQVKYQDLTPVDAAIDHGQVEALRVLLDAKKDDGRFRVSLESRHAALVRAANKSVACVPPLLASGACWGGNKSYVVQGIGAIRGLFVSGGHYLDRLHCNPGSNLNCISRKLLMLYLQCQREIRLREDGKKDAKACAARSVLCRYILTGRPMHRPITINEEVGSILVPNDPTVSAGVWSYFTSSALPIDPRIKMMSDVEDADMQQALKNVFYPSVIDPLIDGLITDTVAPKSQPLCTMKKQAIVGCKEQPNRW